MDSADETFRKMQEVVIDSAMTDTLAIAAEINRNLLTEVISAEELEKYAKYLCERWEADGYRYAHIALNGSLYLVDDEYSSQYISDELPDESVRVDGLNRVEVISIEFMAISSEETIGSQVYPVQKIYMKGLVEASAVLVFDEDDEDDFGEYQDCLIPLDGYARIEYDAMTPNKARAWLELYAPSLKQTLDSLVALEDSAERIMKLKEIASIPFETTIDDYDQQLEVVKAYLESVLMLDYSLPYLVEIIGSIEPIGAQVSTIIVHSRMPEAFQVTDLIIKRDDDQSVFTIHLRGDLIPRNHAATQPIIIPIQSVRSAVSVRKMIFGD